MPDRRTLSDPQDHTHVRIVEAYEARYWTAKLDVTEAELRALIASHGAAVVSLMRAIGVKKIEGAIKNRSQ